ncbi:uncharacterized protein [Parasteatoda tepidariorum]|uniref:uncharacterized protein n=1 Tax=Parasteatoda tepidariorum TaxID=114398 RepID=UPI00077FE2F9|nr:uncharacterized protein LOC122270288 [Parasteatoda tepidariorum]
MNILKYTHKKFAALGFTALSIAAGSMYLRKKIEDSIGNSTVCKSSIEDLLKHNPSVELLGKPVTWCNPSLLDRSNRITKDVANINVPVAGPKKAGFLVIDAFKQEADTTWTVNVLKLKLDDTEILIK